MKQILMDDHSRSSCLIQAEKLNLDELSQKSFSFIIFRQHSINYYKQKRNKFFS